MADLDRKARRERAKELGRAAYRLGQAGEIIGNVITEGEDKRLLEYHRGRIFIELWHPWRSDASEDEFSRLRVRYAGSLVLELRWTKAGSFRVLKFERGEWERSVQARACF
jgi:hypothetical protein